MQDTLLQYAQKQVTPSSTSKSPNSLSLWRQFIKLMRVNHKTRWANKVEKCPCGHYTGFGISRIQHSIWNGSKVSFRLGTCEPFTFSRCVVCLFKFSLTQAQLMLSALVQIFDGHHSPQNPVWSAVVTHPLGTAPGFSWKWAETLKLDLFLWLMTNIYRDYCRFWSGLCDVWSVPYALLTAYVTQT